MCPMCPNPSCETLVGTEAGTLGWECDGEDADWDAASGIVRVQGQKQSSHTCHQARGASVWPGERDDARWARAGHMEDEVGDDKQ